MNVHIVHYTRTKYRAQIFLCSNRSVRKNSRNLILKLFFVSWKEIGYSIEERIQDLKVY